MKKRAIALILLLLMFYCAPRVFAWVHERPSENIIFDEHVENAATDGSATVGVGVHVVQYHENDPQLGDCVRLGVVATANSREMISYGFALDDYVWESVSSELTLGDDEGELVPMDWPVRFYGGPRSAEYEDVWVCSNGFLCFNNTSTDRYYSKNIPDVEGLNGFIAPFWKDLNPSQGSITTGTVAHQSYWGMIEGFCISWNNVPDKNGVPHSFQVIMEYADNSVKGLDTQSRIIFQYKSVSLSDLDTTIGIENQRGSKGNSYSLQDIGNQQSIILQTPPKMAYIHSLTIRVSEDDDYAWTDIINDQQWIRGHNVVLEQDIEDPDKGYEIAFEGSSTLLLAAVSLLAPPPVGEIAAAAGFIMGPIFVTKDLCEYAAKKQAEAQLFKTDSLTYATAKAVDTPDSAYSTVVDADVCVSVFWFFTDDNDRGHSLKVTTELCYYNVTAGMPDPSKTISTSVNLGFPVGSPPNTPSKPSGYDTCYVGETYPYYAKTTDPDGDDLYYLFDWDDGSTTTIGPYASGVRVSTSHTWNSCGAHYVKVKAYDGYYWSSWSSSLMVTVFNRGGGGGGGCPYVYTWNGQRYVMDNNLLPASEMSTGDIEDYYRLEQLLVPTYQGARRSAYSLQIREFEHEHDYFDQVKLLAVDHNSDVNVAVTPYGEILTYNNPEPPICAVDDEGIDVLSLLSSVDGNYYEGYNGSYVTLTFAPTDLSNGAKLVIRDDAPVWPKSPVYVQTVNTTGHWNTVATFHTRTYWATDIINMTDYLPDANGDLKVRLCFVSNDKIDYVGLDTTPQASIEIRQANLITAFHSTQGNVKPLLIKNDQTYAELIPGEQIQLTFLLRNNQNQERTFILYTEGHYEAIG